MIEIKELNKICEAIPILNLNEKQIEELQKVLLLLGYPVGSIDGLIGKRTLTAWQEFKADIYQGNPELIGKGSINKINELINKEIDIDFSTKEKAIKSIIAEAIKQGLTLKTQHCYILATVQIETANTFKPVREAFWLSENFRKKDPVIKRYYPYYGRGLVQITWKGNYQKYSDILGVDLVKNPDKALDPKISLFILIHGFKTGAFTGRKLTDYVNTNKTDFFNARRCINGLDKANYIENIARDYMKKYEELAK